MHRSKSKNVYDKKIQMYNWANYKKQRNFCVTLLTKKEYFQNLNVQIYQTTKNFGKQLSHTLIIKD